MKLYVYDHCPYCVKARMVFPLKKVPFQLITLLNDDEKTPTSMIGKKMVPILEIEPGRFMPESMDIVAFIDENFSQKMILKKEDPELLNILNTSKKPYYSLCFPRWVNSNMEEFKTPSARQYFKDKKEKMIGDFSSALKNTDYFKKEIMKNLLKIEDKINPEGSWYLGDNISFNDFHLFAFLRNLTIVEKICFPPLLGIYMNNCSKIIKVPLLNK